MPSDYRDLPSAAETIVTCPPDKVGKLRGIHISNAGTNARLVTLQDVFTPDVSNGEASPSEQTVTLFKRNIASGEDIDENDIGLDGIEFIGALKIIGSVADTDYHITTVYEFE